MCEADTTSNQQTVEDTVRPGDMSLEEIMCEQTMEVGMNWQVKVIVKCTEQSCEQVDVEIPKSMPWVPLASKRVQVPVVYCNENGMNDTPGIVVVVPLSTSDLVITGGKLAVDEDKIEQVRCNSPDESIDGQPMLTRQVTVESNGIVVDLKVVPDSVLKASCNQLRIHGLVVSLVLVISGLRVGG